VITRSVTPLSNPQPAPDWRDQFDTFFGADRSATSPSSGTAAPSLFHLTTCRKWRIAEGGSHALAHR
jgi:hypothetical protein